MASHPASSPPPRRQLPANPEGGQEKPKPKREKHQNAGDIPKAQAAMEAFSQDGRRYKLQRLLGKGAYGAVYTAIDRDDQRKRVAVKHIVNGFTTDTDARRIYREISVMNHFDHPNIVQLRHVLAPRDPENFKHIYLVIELMETDLHKVIHSRQDLTSDHISYFLYQLLCALRHLHAAGVLHRDLKPSNLLVNANCLLKVCDFGLAREADVTLSTALTEYVVTRWYRAPEVLLSGGRYSEAIDIWSAGCILAELLLRRPLFPGENYLHQLQLIIHTLGSPQEERLDFIRNPSAKAFIINQPYSRGSSMESIFPHVKGPCLDLLGRMLAFDPRDRITLQQCLEHPFLRRVRSARKSVSELELPRKFRLGVKLRCLEVDMTRRLFLRQLCRMDVAVGLPEESILDRTVLGLPAPEVQDDDQEEEEDDDEFQDAVTGPGEAEAAVVMPGGVESEALGQYCNGVDDSIDQEANTEYWRSARERVDELVAQSRQQEASLGESSGVDPSMLADMLAQYNTQSAAQVEGAAAGGGGGGDDGGSVSNFAALPGRKQKQEVIDLVADGLLAEEAVIDDDDGFRSADEGDSGDDEDMDGARSGTLRAHRSLRMMKGARSRQAFNYYGGYGDPEAESTAERIALPEYAQSGAAVASRGRVLEDSLEAEAAAQVAARRRSAAAQARSRRSSAGVGDDLGASRGSLAAAGANVVTGGRQAWA